MKKQIQLLILADVIFLFGSGLYGPIYAIFVQKIGGDILDAGIAYAIFLIVMATLEYPVGKLMLKYEKKYFLAAAYLLSALAILGYILVGSVTELFIIQIIMGIAIAIGDPAWDAWFSDMIPKKESGFDWAIYHMLAGYGTGFSALVGGVIAKFLGFDKLFLLGGAIAILSFFVVIFMKAEKLEPTGLKVFHRRHSHLHKRRGHRKIS